MKWRIERQYCCGLWRGGRCKDCPVVKHREECIGRVTDHMKREWKIAALKSADRVMRRMEVFTTDDIWIDLEKRNVERPHEPRAMGSIIRILTDGEEIEWTKAITTSRLPWANGRTIKIYKVMG